jgi:hypothetical protein
MVTSLMATRVATLRRARRGAVGCESVLTRCFLGGSKQTRTADPLLVRQVL